MLVAANCALGEVDEQRFLVISLHTPSNSIYGSSRKREERKKSMWPYAPVCAAGWLIRSMCGATSSCSFLLGILAVDV